MQDELRYRLALTSIPHIGVVQARILLEKFGTAKAIFQAKRSHLEHTEGMGKRKTAHIKGFRDFSKVEKELTFLEKYGIRTLFITDSAYPARLLTCYDPPTLLFCKGIADLNSARMVSVVGTRNNTAYGKNSTEALVRNLAEYASTVVSGMAHGIDACAHRAALKNHLPTVGVLAHGLRYMYPPEHKPLASEMIQAGGALLTEYWSDEAPDKHLFPSRNRIVAGLCDALIVMESGLKGGSMLTAELASGYHKDIFTFPGRSIDQTSEGCNHLIQINKAQILLRPAQLPEYLGWKSMPRSHTSRQTTLPLSLTEQEHTIMGLFDNNGTLHIDQLCQSSGLSMHVVSSALLKLEMQGLVETLPGKLYQRK